MNTTELLAVFSDPQTIHNLSFGEKMGGVAITAALGMGITFLGLIFIMYLINGLTAALKEKNVVDTTKTTEALIESGDVDEEEVEEENYDELVAAITVAISLQLGGGRKFVVTNIEKVQTDAPIWSRMGTIEQLSSRF